MAQTETAQLKHPLVMIHGLGAKGTYGPVDYFYGLPKRFREAGNEVFIADLTAWQTIEHRAEELKKQIDRAFPDRQVNLIGHSMGGLDARYLTSRLGFAERVASVTTVGTPNKGNLLADLALGYIPEAAFEAVDFLLAFFQSTSRAFHQMTSKHHAEIFAREVPDMPGVGYFSATSTITAPLIKHALPIFWLSSTVLQKLEGDNDGFVSVESSKWGEHICTYNGDHYGQIGQFLGHSRGLDHYAFFDEILGRLHKEGF